MTEKTHLAQMDEEKDDAHLFHTVQREGRWLFMFTVVPLVLMGVICFVLMAVDASKLSASRHDRQYPRDMRYLGLFLHALGEERVLALDYYNDSTNLRGLAYRAAIAKSESLSGPIASFASYAQLTTLRNLVIARLPTATTRFHQYVAVGSDVLLEMNRMLESLTSSRQRDVLSVLCATRYFVNTRWQTAVWRELASWDQATARKWMSKYRTGVDTLNPDLACVQAFALPVKLPNVTVVVPRQMQAITSSLLVDENKLPRGQLTDHMARLRLYSSQWDRTMSDVEDDLDARERRFAVSVVLTLFGFLASVIGALASSHAIRMHSSTQLSYAQIRADHADTESHLSNFKEAFSTMNIADIENSIECVKNYPSRVITTCGDLMGLLLRVRPFLSQSVFGDLESVSATNRISGKTTGMLAQDVVSQEQALRQAVRRDFRSEMGMQLVSAVYMCISLEPFQQKIRWDLTARKGLLDRDNNDFSVIHEHFETDYLSPALEMYLSQIQTAVNSNHGVIHSISDNMVIVLWNVVSSTYIPQVNAVSAAVAIAKSFNQVLHQHSKVFGNVYKRPSICILSSDAMAGNVPLSGAKAKSVFIIGRCAHLAEKVEQLTDIHNSPIIMDKETASAAQTHISSLDYAARPVALLRDRAGDEVELWVLHMHRIKQDRLKAWSGAFHAVQKTYFQNRFDTGLSALMEYMDTYGNQPAFDSKRNKEPFDDVSAKWVIAMLKAKAIAVSRSDQKPVAPMMQ
eukprot:PhM_4_TR1308/c3_g4_i1/m.105516